MIRFVVGFCIAILWAGFASAHEIRPAYLEITETAAGEFAVKWKQPVMDGKRLKLDPILPDNCEESEPVLQGSGATVLSSWVAKCDLRAGEISIDGLDRTLTDVFVKLAYLDGEQTSGLLRPAGDGFALGQPASSPVFAYFWIGVEHIIYGYDHLLFVIGVVLLVRLRQLLWTLTAFTLAHSITLGLSALTNISVPGPPVEILIAASIAFLAAEAVNRSRGGEPTLAARAPWIIAFGFGLLHGFGFAGALSDIGLPPGAELAALFLFNVGVEVGQIACVLVLLGLGWIVKTLSAPSLQSARTGLAYCIGIIGSFWAIERIAATFI